MAGKSPPQFKNLNDTRDIVTLMTHYTMHGLRHAPGSNHVCDSFSGMFTFLSVIYKYNLHSSDWTHNFVPIVPFLFHGLLCTYETYSQI